MPRQAFNLVLVITFALVGEQLLSVSACKCLPLPSPSHCRTNFLALVKITNAIANESKHSKVYSFELIAPLRNTDGKTLQGFTTMSSPLYSANCGVMLQVNQTYLIGGGWHHQTQDPFLFSCHSFHEKWDLLGDRSQQKLNTYMQECDNLDKLAKEPPVLA